MINGKRIVIASDGAAQILVGLSTTEAVLRRSGLVHTKVKAVERSESLSHFTRPLSALLPPAAPRSPALHLRAYLCRFAQSVPIATSHLLALRSIAKHWMHILLY